MTTQRRTTGWSARVGSRAARPKVRERLKDDTRAAIVEASLDLFETSGYEQTTVEDISAKAGIASRTFFRHFESKAAVVYNSGPDIAQRSAALVGYVVLRPASESPIEAMAAVARQMLVDLFEDDGTAARQLRVIMAEPTLRSAGRGFGHNGPVMTQGFAARLHCSANDLEPRILGAAFTEAIWVILERWIDGGGRREQLPAVVDEQFAALRDIVG